MKKVCLPLLLYTFAFFVLVSCRQEDGSPIRNVRFDPNLLSRSMDATPCSSYDYYYQDQKVDLGNVYTRQILVAFADGSSFQEQKKAAEKYGFIKSMAGSTNTNSATLYTLELKDGLNCKQAEQAIQILKRDPVVSYAAPYFLKDDNLLGIGNEAIVTMRTGGRTELAQLLESYKASIVTPLSSTVYVVKVDKTSGGNALELANYLSSQENVATAEPDFVMSLAPALPVSSKRENRTGTVR